MDLLLRGASVPCKPFLAALTVCVLSLGTVAYAATDSVAANSPVAANSIEAYSDAVLLDVPSETPLDISAESLLPSEIAAQLASESANSPVTNESSALTIAEPGTLGLMALAGLMGGAMTMRRRLG